jgi:outer membrane biosynthesis protein TonB
MLKRAQPLPPIPAELEADVISINLPIDFSLIRR